MTKLEKLLAQKLADSISQQAALLRAMDLPTDGIFKELRTINMRLVTDLPPFDEHYEHVRQSVNSGAM